MKKFHLALVALTIIGSTVTATATQIQLTCIIPCIQLTGDSSHLNPSFTSLRQGRVFWADPIFANELSAVSGRRQ
jgi:hypothetical protein